MSTRSHLLSKHIQHASFAARMLDASVCARACSCTCMCACGVCARACVFVSFMPNEYQGLVLTCEAKEKVARSTCPPEKDEAGAVIIDPVTRAPKPSACFCPVTDGQQVCACACVCICVCICVLTDSKEIQAWRRFDIHTHTNIHAGAGPDVPHPKGQRLERDSKPRHPHRALGGSCLPGILALGATRDKTRTATQ